MPKYLVETISQFRMRYVVEAKTQEHAADTVTMEEAEEFSQKHIGEVITSVWEVDDDMIVDIFYDDHPYLSEDNKTPERALRNVHKVNYDE